MTVSLAHISGLGTHTSFWAGYQPGAPDSTLGGLYPEVFLLISPSKLQPKYHPLLKLAYLAYLFASKYSACFTVHPCFGPASVRWLMWPAQCSQYHLIE